MGLRQSLVAFSSVLCLWLGPGKTVLAGQPPLEESAVRKVIQQLVDGFNTRNADGIAQLYALDADRRDATGTYAHGRSEVAAMYKRTFQALPQDLRTRFEFSIRFLRSDVALADGNYILSDGRTGPFTIITTKESGQWLVSAGRQGAAFP